MHVYSSLLTLLVLVRLQITFLNTDACLSSLPQFAYVPTSSHWLTKYICLYLLFSLLHVGSMSCYLSSLLFTTSYIFLSLCMTVFTISLYATAIILISFVCATLPLPVFPSSFMYFLFSFLALSGAAGFYFPRLLFGSWYRSTAC